MEAQRAGSEGPTRRLTLLCLIRCYGMTVVPPPPTPPPPGIGAVLCRVSSLRRGSSAIVGGHLLLFGVFCPSSSVGCCRSLDCPISMNVLYLYSRFTPVPGDPIPR
jgi:hypothetical protein